MNIISYLYDIIIHIVHYNVDREEQFFGLNEYDCRQKY